MQIYGDALMIETVRGSEANAFLMDHGSSAEKAIRDHLAGVKPESLSKDCCLSPVEYLYSFSIKVAGKALEVEIGWGEIKTGPVFAPACTVRIGAD